MEENNVLVNEDELFHFVDNSTIESERITAPRYSYWKSVFRVFFRKKLNWVVLAVLTLLLLVAFIYPMFVPYLPTNATINPNILNSQSYNLSASQAAAFHAGEARIHWIFGSGSYGQPIFDGIWTSARTSFTLALICTAINMTLGVVIGALWGFSKKVDVVMTQVYNVVANVPFILFVSVFVYIVGSGFWSFVEALCITGWIGIAYFIRTQVIIIRDREYNLASKCLGTPIIRIVTRNILPFMTSVIVTILATELPSYMSYEVFLSYIGIGLSAENPSIGVMIQEGQSDMSSRPWKFWPPVVIVSILTVTLFLIGQNIADASDPRTHME